MKTVKVKLINKANARGGNHRPEFRIPGSNALDGAERSIATAIYDFLNVIPEKRVLEILRSPTAYQTRFQDYLTDVSAEYLDDMARGIFNGWAEGARFGAEMIRQGLNTALRRAGSDLRIVSNKRESPRFVTKSIDETEWSITVGNFDTQPENMEGKVYARFRSAKIFADLTDDIVLNIETAIANGFRARQAFATGRTVTGLTPDQTARALYGILAEISPVGASSVTGADYASKIVPNVNGLTPEWARAVENNMNAVAAQQLNAGVPPAQALARVERAGRIYGNKLRRARARRIARTEISFAQNRAQQDMYVQAVNDGIVSLDDQKEWITGPYDVCNICVPMGGTQVPVTGVFTLPNGNQEEYPPAHPNCRCVTRLVPSFIDQPKRIGTNTPDDPYRYEFPGGFVADVTAVKR